MATDWEKIVRNLPREERLKIAKGELHDHPELAEVQAELLRVLADDRCREVWAATAGNPAIPLDVLEAVVAKAKEQPHEDSSGVYKLAVNNLVFPVEEAYKLLSNDPFARYGRARGSNVVSVMDLSNADRMAEIFELAYAEELARPAGAEVVTSILQQICNGWDMTDEQVSRVLDLPHVRLHRTMAETWRNHDLLSHETRMRFATHPDTDVRRYAARWLTRRMDVDAFEALFSDSDPEVRAVTFRYNLASHDPYANYGDGVRRNRDEDEARMDLVRRMLASKDDGDRAQIVVNADESMGRLLLAERGQGVLRALLTDTGLAVERHYDEVASAICELAAERLPVEGLVANFDILNDRQVKILVNRACPHGWWGNDSYMREANKREAFIDMLARHEKPAYRKLAVDCSAHIVNRGTPVSDACKRRLVALCDDAAPLVAQAARDMAKKRAPGLVPKKRQGVVRRPRTLADLKAAVGGMRRSDNVREM